MLGKIWKRSTRTALAVLKQASEDTEARVR